MTHYNICMKKKKSIFTQSNKCVSHLSCNKRSELDYLKAFARTKILIITISQYPITVERSKT